MIEEIISQIQYLFMAIMPFIVGLSLALPGYILLVKILNKLSKEISKKKSYEQEMASYDHLETKTIDHLPTGISLDELRLNDGEIPNRAGHQKS